MSAKRWAEVWRRAPAALCPEADPPCNDPSRAYWLPSRPASVAPETSYHPGPLLDAFVDFEDWRGRSITVQWEEACVWAPTAMRPHRDARHHVGVGPRSRAQ